MLDDRLSIDVSVLWWLVRIVGVDVGVNRLEVSHQFSAFSLESLCVSDSGGIDVFLCHV